MRFTGCTCVCCNNTFCETDDVVVCPECGSPHHRDCWNEKGECANASLHADGYSWVFPEELRPKEEKKPSQADPISTDYKFKNGEKAVVCPHCKALNYGNDAFCMKCRKPFIEHNENTIPPQQEFPNDTPAGMYGYERMSDDNSYEYFQRFGGVRPDIMIDGIPVIEYADYIGDKKSGRYIRQFLNMERFGRKLSVSICAFLFGPIWYFYRKMFKEGLIFLLAFLLLTCVQAWCGITESTKAVYAEMGNVYSELISGEITPVEMEEQLLEIQERLINTEPTKEDELKNAVNTVTEVLNIVLLLIMTFFADHLYKRKITADIMKIRLECSDMPTYRRTLHERGGVSVGGAILAIAAKLIIAAIPIIPAYVYMFSSMM